MGLKMRFVRTVCLLAIVLVGTVFIYASFQPRMRFSQPLPAVSLLAAIKTTYHCYHDQIYLGQSKADVLFLGSSRTAAALDPKLVMSDYQAVTGESREVFLFHTPWENPEIVYAFFRDYLANNPSPQVALFALTPAEELEPPVRYIHPLFQSFAPPYLYLDILKPSDVVHSQFFALSDFFRILIHHLDMSLSRFLVLDFSFAVPEGDNCRSQKEAAGSLVPEMLRFESFQALLDTELETTLPDIEPDRIGRADGLLKTYAGRGKMTQFTNEAIKEWGDTNTWPDDGRHFWINGALSGRNLEYYRRIVVLAKSNNVKVGFYFLPQLLLPEPPSTQVADLAESLGAPIYMLPFEYTRVSYHHYRDAVHVAPEFQPVYSAWFASLIEQVEGN